MRIGFVLLYAETFLRCLRLWRRRLKSTDDPRIMLTILTALGYIAFHTLLSGTESRYGQVMIPLLGILVPYQVWHLFPSDGLDYVPKK